MVGRTKLVAGAATAVLIGAIAPLAIMRAPGSTDAPEAVLDQLLQAMQQGDVAAYLACLTGEPRDAARRDVESRRGGEFGAELRRAAAEIKGQALLKTESRGPDEVYVLVDRVYEKRPWELQAYRLRRERGRWLIFAIEPARPHDPPVPYGTPVVTATPEPRDGGQ